MPNILNGEAIGALWDAHKRPVQKTNSIAGAELLRRIASDGWALRADIEDIFYLYDSRLDGQVDIKALSATFELPWRNVYYLPKARSNSVSGSQELAAADVAGLLIHIERLGFSLDPMPLVEALLPSIRSQKRITDSELSVLWFEKNRHKMAPQLVQVNDHAKEAANSESLRTPRGYEVQIWRDSVGRPLWLSADAPKFRRHASPQETVCPDCDYTWYRGDPDSSANHRREHKLRMKVLDPQPLSAFANARLTEEGPELVTTKSPAWKHKEIYERAKFFRREFRYDFVQWESSTGDRDPSAHGFLFVDEGGAVVGACAFRLREREDKRRWGLQWVWVCPKARRTGVLAKYWPSFRKRFGDFDVEGPVSPAMEAFVIKQGDANLLGYDPNRR